MPSSGTWRIDANPRAFGTGLDREIPSSLPEESAVHVNENRSLWIIPLALSLVGIVMIVSLTSNYWQALRQIQFLGLGLTLMYCCSLLPLAFIRRMSGLFWVLAMLMVLGTLIPGIGVKVGGARRWVNIGFQFQPLEILTMAVPLFLAARLASPKRDGIQCFYRPTLSMATVSAVPLFFQPNMGGIILVFAICMSMHVISKGWKYPLIGGMFLSVLFIIMIYYEPYRMRRLMAFLDPWDDPMDRGFQIIQGLVAFSNGGVLGVGLGKGLQKLEYLPAAHTDYIFPAIGEEFGLFGTLLIVMMYAYWTLKSYMLYRRSKDPYISLLIWGITASILFPMFVNLAGVMKLMPLTGIPLPFISFGGTALVFMWVKVGIILRVSMELDFLDAADERR